MKRPVFKAILSTLLFLLFAYLAFSGALLYFGKTGLMLGVSRNTWRETHARAAFSMGVIVLLHMVLNIRLYHGEWKTLFRRGQGIAKAGAGSGGDAAASDTVREEAQVNGKSNGKDKENPSAIRIFLSRFSLFQLMTISLMAALGVAVKSVITPVAHILTGPLYIPGGVVAGGVYMMFLVLAASLTGMRGAAMLCGLCQGVIVLVVGVAGSHGVLSILTYTLTGLAVDLLLLLMRHKGCCVLCCFFGGMAANLTGTLLVNVAFFSLPFIPLVLSMAAGALSGGLGGVLAWVLTSRLRKYRVA